MLSSKDDSDGSYINMMINNDHILLRFNTSHSRDDILDRIWNEMVNKSEFFDIDAIIDIIYDSEKYNL